MAILHCQRRGCQNPVAYPGALFCGAACSQEVEADRNLKKIITRCLSCGELVEGVIEGLGFPDHDHSHANDDDLGKACPHTSVETTEGTTSLPTTIDQLFHSLWTKAVGTPGYDKDQWRRLEAWLLYNQVTKPRKQG